MGDSFAGDLGKAIVGVGVGFAAFVLLTGGGGGLGLGRDGGGRGEQPVPPRPRDEKPLNFTLSSRGIEPRDVDWKPPVDARVLTVDEVIARVKEGGRDDLALKLSGAALQSAIEEVLSRLRAAGLAVKVVDTSAAPKVAGIPRGHYRR